MPFISIVIPLYNRERLVGRTIESCLGQDFSDFEIIVVDDASTDRSCAMVEAFNDPRLQLLRHTVNRGVCPARNTGIENAHGEWILPLDSDDELLHGALGKAALLARNTPDDIAMIRLMNRMSTGELSPDPPLAPGVWDYAAYLRWAESTLDTRRSDASKIIRRNSLHKVKYPEDRTLEAKFHLDFSKVFMTMSAPLELVLVHQDADNRLTRPNPVRTLATAPRMVPGMKALLAEHGVALAKWAPRLYFQTLCGLATVQFISGNRRDGLRTISTALAQRPFSPRAIVILLSGMIDGRLLTYLQAARLAWRQR